MVYHVNAYQFWSCSLQLFFNKKNLVTYMASRNNSKNILSSFFFCFTETCKNKDLTVRPLFLDFSLKLRMINIIVQDCLLMLYPHVTKFSTRAIINDSGNIFLTFHKISNLKMNTVIDFQLIFFVKVMFSRNYISNIWNMFFFLFKWEM